MACAPVPALKRFKVYAMTFDGEIKEVFVEANFSFNNPTGLIFRRFDDNTSRYMAVAEFQPGYFTGYHEVPFNVHEEY